MKYYTRLKLYKTKNLVLDPATLRSTSYEWWQLTGKVSGVVIFNTYKYSVTTGKHIDKIFCVLKDLGQEWIEVQSPTNLTLRWVDEVETAITWQMAELDRLLATHNTPRARLNIYSGAAQGRRFQIARMAQNLVNLQKVLELMRNRNNAVAEDTEAA